MEICFSGFDFTLLIRSEVWDHFVLHYIISHKWRLSLAFVGWFPFWCFQVLCCDLIIFFKKSHPGLNIYNPNLSDSKLKVYFYVWVSENELVMGEKLFLHFAFSQCWKLFESFHSHEKLCVVHECLHKKFESEKTFWPVFFEEKVFFLLLFYP